MPEKKWDWSKWILIVGLLIASVYFYTYSSRTEEQLKAKTEMYEAAAAESVFYKDELGRYATRSEQVQSMKVKDFVDAVFENEAMKKLQADVEFSKEKLKKGGSVTHIETQGAITQTTPTTETVAINKEGDTLPTYKSKFKDDWIAYSIVADKKDITLDFKYRDEFSVVLGTEKDTSVGFFKRLFQEPKRYAWVTSSSPYSQIKESKTYHVKQYDPGRLSFGLVAAYGYDLDQFKRSTFVGLGLSYRLFSFGKKEE